MAKPRGNADVSRVVRACRTAIDDSFPGLGKRLGCGLQGCVYKLGRVRALKLSVTGARRHDAGPFMWLRQYKTRFGALHPALPVIYEFGVLTDCLMSKKAQKLPRLPSGRVRPEGKHHPNQRDGRRAFAVSREDLANVPKMKGYAEAMDLLCALAEWTNGDEHTRTRGRPPSGFLKVNQRAIFLLPPEARRMFSSIYALHVWLWERGMVLEDAYDENIGVRRVKGGRDEYVVRDIGFLAPRTSAPSWARNSYLDSWIVARVNLLGGM